MLARFKSVTLFALVALAVGMPAHAATLGNGGTDVAMVNIATDGTLSGISGRIGIDPETNDWVVKIDTSSNTDVFFEIVDPGDPVGVGFSYSIYGCAAGCTGAIGDVYNEDIGALNVTDKERVWTLLAGNEYMVRINGTTPSKNYSIEVSAVPLPAAAWLFMSALAGFGLLSRKTTKVAA